MKCFVSAQVVSIAESQSRRTRLTMSNEASKVPANDTVPGSTLPRVELAGYQRSCGEGGWGGRTSFLMYCAISFEVLATTHQVNELRSIMRALTFSMWYFSIASIAKELVAECGRSSRNSYREQQPLAACPLSVEVVRFWSIVAEKVLRTMSTDLIWAIHNPQRMISHT